MVCAFLIALAPVCAEVTELRPIPGPAVVPAPAAVEVESRVDAPAGVTLASTQPARYSIGEPTDEEQLYLELINRARANPAAEAERLRSITDPDVVASYGFFQVNLAAMAKQIAAIAPQPPLAMNERLLAAARDHSADMLTNAFQDHQGSDGSSPVQRAVTAGYSPWWFGENVSAYARSVEHGHAAFEVDFGFIDGMQSPPGHRNNIHHPAYREIGVGVAFGRNGNVGPQLVTQDFGARAGAGPLLTGVVFYDLNGNQFYDLGEGVGGVEVTVDGASWYAVTAGSGGYAVPVPAQRRATLRFTLAGQDAVERVVDVGTNNVKVDCLLQYAPPRVTGPNPAVVRQTNLYQFTAVTAATAYEWESRQRVPSEWVEGAETGVTRVVCDVTPGVPVTVSDVVAEGKAAFHLTHTTPQDQGILPQHTLRISSASEISFASRLGWAATGQVARAQISTDAGGHWTDWWSRAGNGSYGQVQFERVTNSLAAWNGQEVQIRFVFDYVSGAYFPQSSPGVGWYLDAIRVRGAEELVDGQHAEAGDTTFAFTPNAATNYCLRVRPRVGERWLQWGPVNLISAGLPASGRVRLLSAPRPAGNRVQLDFVVLAGSATNFVVEQASFPGGPWTPDPTAVVQPPSGDAPYRVDAAAGADAAFYRIRFW